MNNPENAVSVFNEGCSCSQAILSTFGEDLGLDNSLALKLADGFGGGMGRMALICGAVTGAFMVVGLKYGRTSINDVDAKQKTMQLVLKFANMFEERNKTLVCKELLGCDISTDDGIKYAKENNLINTLCPKYVADAAEILEEIL